MLRKAKKYTQNVTSNPTPKFKFFFLDLAKSGRSGQYLAGTEKMTGSTDFRSHTDVNPTSCGVIQNQRSKIRRSNTNAGGTFRKISKSDRVVI